MTRKKEVSEKSLELNVCAEMLQCLRGYPDYRKALWIGLTQREERQQGLDTRIRNADDLALMLQFKSPWATYYGDNFYKFSVNKRQHEALERLGNPEAVFYAFPLYSRWTKADKDAPNLLQDTWLLPVSCIPSGGLARESTPIVVSRRNQSSVKVKSDTYPYWEATCEAVNAREYFERDLRETVDRPRLVRVALLKEWIEFSEMAALRFRNLGIFYIPL